MEINLLRNNEEILKFINEVERDKATPTELSKILNNYNPLAKNNENILWSYYTPDEVVKLAYAILYKNGFEFESGMRILEPACGVGRFLRYIPIQRFGDTITIDCFDIDQEAIKIAKYVYSFKNFNFHNYSFENYFYDKNGVQIASSLMTKYDLIIGNPPFLDRYQTQFSDKEKKALEQYTIHTLHEWFLVRCSMLLKRNGYLLFVMPSSYFDNNENNVSRDILFESLKMVEAYRLPRGMFDETSISTDIILLKKI